MLGISTPTAGPLAVRSKNIARCAENGFGNTYGEKETMMDFTEKLEGDELLAFRKELNNFHLELWAIQFAEQPIPDCCRKLAESIRKRHYEITKKFKLLDT